MEDAKHEDKAHPALEEEEEGMPPGQELSLEKEEEDGASAEEEEEAKAALQDLQEQEVEAKPGTLIERADENEEKVE